MGNSSLYCPDAYPKGTSPLSVPVMNSSRVLQVALNNIDQKLDADDFSVSTVYTTDSMMIKAAVAASNVSQEGVIYDYGKLTSLHVNKNELKKKLFHRKKKISKQLDSAWVARKQNLCPTPEDIRILHASDPYVPIKLVGYGNSASIQSNGLSAFIDTSTLTSTFRLNIEQSRVFGVLVPKESNRQKDNLKDALEVVCMC